MRTLALVRPTWRHARSQVVEEHAARTVRRPGAHGYGGRQGAGLIGHFSRGRGSRARSADGGEDAQRSLQLSTMNAMKTTVSSVCGGAMDERLALEFNR